MQSAQRATTFIYRSHMNLCVMNLNFKFMSQFFVLFCFIGLEAWKF